MPRPIREIAIDITDHWPNPWFGAVPYLRALHTLEDMQDNYGVESAHTIVSYFLANAKTWRGPDARRIKAELRGILA